MDTRERLEETPDRNGEFPRLSEAQIQALAGRREAAHAAGRDAVPGKVAVVAGYGGHETLIAVHGPQLALDDRGYILTGRDAARSPRQDGSQELGHEPYLLETSRRVRGGRREERIDQTRGLPVGKLS